MTIEDDKRQADGPEQQHGQQTESAVAGGGEVSADAPELHEEDPHLTPELAVADSLSSALKHLRDSADALDGMPLDEAKVSAAEQVAEAAAELDEQIGSIARSDDG